MMNNVPKLRFSEFNNTWDIVEMNKFATIMKGNGLCKADISSNNSGTPCVLYGQLYTIYGEVIKDVNSRTLKEDKNFIRSIKNDVLIPASGETAIDISTASCILEDNVILGGDLNIIRTYETDGRFLSYLLNHQQRLSIARLAQGASVVHLYASHLRELKVPLPGIEEQSKIVEFLAVIEAKIETQKKIVNSHKELKKGLMQKIFSQEIRFKDENGEEYPEWEEKQLDQLGIFARGTALSKSDLSKTGTPCILYGELFTTYNEIINSVKSKTTLSKDVVINSYSNDLLFPTSTTVDAMSLISPSSLKVEGVVIGGDILIFRPKKEVSSDFLSYQINSIKKAAFSKAGQGSTIIHINTDVLKKSMVGIPILREQNKITNILSGFDKKINIENQILEKWQNIKKGLLQQMFV